MQRIRRMLAATGSGRGRQPDPPGRLARLLFALLLAVVLVAPAGPAEALPFSLPWGRQDRAAGPGGTPSAAAKLQEVPPPAAVQQLGELLAEREPRLEILSPRPGERIGPGPWTLRLQLQDWPLVDLADLGIGPHLVAQLDEEAPQRLTSLESTMPPLRPGSHRLTVYAARPWGEAVKNPGAYRQIHLHRAAENPLTLPAPGSPQLILASPTGLWSGEPVLIDWLLLDAPLKNLRSEGADWRLRISVNGDSFLVDRQTPLWLKGWPSGRSGILLELVDGRGEPLNPPFNSLATEVDRTASGSPPAWLGQRLDEETIDRLLARREPPGGRGEEDLPEPASGEAALPNPPPSEEEEEEGTEADSLPESSPGSVPAEGAVPERPQEVSPAPLQDGDRGDSEAGPPLPSSAAEPVVDATGAAPEQDPLAEEPVDDDAPQPDPGSLPFPTEGSPGQVAAS